MMLPEIPFEIPDIFLATLSKIPDFSFADAISKFETAFCNSDFILLTGAFWLLPAKFTTCPKEALADLSISFVLS